MMSSMTPAAGRKMCGINFRHGDREGPEREKENEQDGKSTPHLTVMLHER
jgi:hypothetical protein